MTAHLLGQIILAAMFIVSASMIAHDIGLNAGRIWRAFAANFGQPRPPVSTRPILPESTKGNIHVR